MKIDIGLVMDPRREPDPARRLASAISDELWRRCGRNGHINWCEADAHLARILGDALTLAIEAEELSAP